MAKSAPVLEVTGLRVERSSTIILDQLDWQVDRGQHWVILGANGSGKTSLLSVITGYLMPTRGTFGVLGNRYGRSDWRELRKHIGLVSSSVRQLMADSEPALQTVVSGKYAMIDYWGRVTASDRKRAVRILGQIGCSHLADRPWIFLSQGERQRILIGRALMARPRLLILDEPCAGLDPAAREHFLQFLQTLGRRRSAPTMVLVTHHVEEIMPVFSNVLLLKYGRMLASGLKRKILTASLLSDVFSAPVRLRRQAERYSLEVTNSVKGVV